MNWKRIFGATILVWIAGAVIHVLTCGGLFKWVYALEPVIARGPEAMKSGAAFLGLNVLGILGAFFFALVYAVVLKAVPGKGAVKGMTYGLLLWLAGGATGMAAMPFFVNMAPGLALYWVIQLLVVSVVNGAIVGMVYRPGGRS